MALKYTSEDGKRVAQLIENSDWDEWIVRFYIDGKLQKGANYHTGDRDDAEETAIYFVNQKG